MVYTRSEAAKELKVSVKTVDRLILRGELKAAKIGNLVRIKKEEIEKFLDDSTFDPEKTGNVIISTNFRLR